MPVKKSPINKTVNNEQSSSTVKEIEHQMNKLQIANKKNGITDKVNNEMNKKDNQDNQKFTPVEVEKERAVIKYINNVLVKDSVKDNYNPIPIKDLYEDFSNLTKIKMMLFKFIDIIKRMGITIEKTNVYHVIGYKLK